MPKNGIEKMNNTAVAVVVETPDSMNPLISIGLYPKISAATIGKIMNVTVGDNFPFNRIIILPINRASPRIPNHIIVLSSEKVLI